MPLISDISFLAQAVPGESAFSWDPVFNLIFFLVGLFVGFLQLWQAQKFYLADQQSKFNQINEATTQIAQRLAVIEGVTNRLIEIDRSLTAINAASGSAQERLFNMLERQNKAEEQTAIATIDASDQLKAIVAQYVADSRLTTTDDLSQLETKIETVLSDLSSTVSQLTQASIKSTEAERGDMAIRDWDERVQEALHDYFKGLLVPVSHNQREAQPATSSAPANVANQQSQRVVVPLVIYLTVNPPRVTLGGKELDVSPSEFRILSKLASSVGKPVQANLLKEYESQSDTQIRVSLTRIRNRITNAGYDPNDYISSQRDTNSYMLRNATFSVASGKG